MSRSRVKKNSYPRLEARGWSDDDPTQMIQKGLDVLSTTAEESGLTVARASLAAATSAVRAAETAKKVAVG